MLRIIALLVLNRHLAEAVAHLEHILAYQAYFGRKEVAGFLHLEVLLVNCLEALVELPKGKDVCKEDIVDI